MDENLHFITSGIKELKTALFYSFSESLLKFPPSVIEIRGVDEDGNTWFAVNKPYRNLEGFDHGFPAELQCFHKECPYYIKVYGRASLMAGTAGMQQQDNLSDKDVLIKLKILHAEYIRLSNLKPAKGNTMRVLINSIANMFRISHGYYFDTN